MHSTAGQLIRAAQDVSFACGRRMSVPWDELPADEFSVFKHLEFEQARREKEIRDREEAERRRGQA